MWGDRMSYIDLGRITPKIAGWVIYREDARPALSHIYHDICPNRPGSGEYVCSVVHNTPTCADCNEPVPHLVLGVYRIVCSGVPKNENI